MLKEFFKGMASSVIGILVFLLLTHGCAAPVMTIIPPDPKNPPQMYTYTTNGYKMTWWIFEEFDGSCMIEYSIYGPKDRVNSLAHGALPCQMMAMFFHSIQPRKQNEVPKAPDLQSPPHSDHD